MGIENREPPTAFSLNVAESHETLPLSRARRYSSDRPAPQEAPVVYRIELFAEFMALLDDPFSHRPAALAAADLDEARFRNLVESWRMRVEADTQGDLGDRYIKAYSARRAALHTARLRQANGAEAAAEDARFLSKEALGFREEAALVGRHPAAESASPAFSHSPPAPAAAPFAAAPRVEPSGVFTAPQYPAPPAPSAAPAPVYYAPPAPPPMGPYHPAPSISAAIPKFARPSNPLAGTADISDVIAKLPLPFARGSGSAPSAAAVPSAGPKAHRIDSGTASMAAFVEGSGFHPSALPPPAHLAPPPAPPERPKRLIRFDPQTGHPLPAPIWVDIPEDPKK